MLQTIKRMFNEYLQPGLKPDDFEGLITLSADAMTTAIAIHGNPEITVEDTFTIGNERYQLIMDVKLKEIKGEVDHE